MTFKPTHRVILASDGHEFPVGTLVQQYNYHPYFVFQKYYDENRLEQYLADSEVEEIK